MLFLRIFGYCQFSIFWLFSMTPGNAATYSCNIPKLNPVECSKNKKNKSGEFKMTHQATANRFSLFSRLAPVVSRILR